MQGRVQELMPLEQAYALKSHRSSLTEMGLVSYPEDWE